MADRSGDIRRGSRRPAPDRRTSRGRSRAGSTATARAPAAAPTPPRVGGHDLARRRSTGRERRQPHPVELRAASGPASSTPTPASTSRTAARRSALDPGHPNVLAPRQADTPHADAGDAVPRRRGRGSSRVDGRRRAAPDPCPGRLGPGRRRRRRREGRRGAALVRGARGAPRAAGRGARRTALRGRRPRGARDLGHPLTGSSRSMGCSVIAMRSSWSTEGRRRAGRSRQRRILGVPGCLRSGDPAVDRRRWGWQVRGPARSGSRMTFPNAKGCLSKPCQRLLTRRRCAARVPPRARPIAQHRDRRGLGGRDATDAGRRSACCSSASLWPHVEARATPAPASGPAGSGPAGSATASGAPIKGGPVTHVHVRRRRHARSDVRRDRRRPGSVHQHVRSAVRPRPAGRPRSRSSPARCPRFLRTG